MKRLQFIIFLLLTFPLSLSAQKGASPLPPFSGTEGVARAVVVGISDYQDPAIPDLRFADRDAEAFADWLRSPAGGSVPGAQIKTLLNQEATRGKIAAALYWLLEMCKEGDRAIIYFSGHGDVETKTISQNGYLLSWDSPPKNYMIGAFPIDNLLETIATLSVQNKAQVVLITDACRAGKLAGSAYGGAQTTNANLAKQLANEIKILSCQGDEYSLEGEQWGGGHGVFTYYLLDGLTGLADKNDNKEVNLSELRNYLEEIVPAEAAPHSQVPIAYGNVSTLLALVDEPTLIALKNRHDRETVAFKPVGSKALPIVAADSALAQLYRKFNEQIESGNLLEPEDSSAYHLYQVLSKEPELLTLHGEMQRNLAAALQDDAQQAINAYLAANPAELKKRYANEKDYERLPRYLRKAAEILGSGNFYYPYIMAKLFYFEGLQLRLEANQGHGNRDTLYLRAIEKQLTALSFQKHAPFILNELGVLHTHLRDDAKAAGYLEAAIELAPEWGLPYVNSCALHYYIGNIDKAKEYGEKAVELMPDFPQVYNFLGWIYADYTRFVNVWRTEELNRLGLELQDDFLYSGAQWGRHLFQQQKQFKRTVELLEQAVKKDTAFFSAWCNLGVVYLELARNREAETCFDKAVQLNPDIHLPYFHLGFIYSSQGKLELSEETYLKGLSLLGDTVSLFTVQYNHSLALLYLQWRKLEKAVELFERNIELAPAYDPLYMLAAHVNLSFANLERKNFEMAEYHGLKPIVGNKNLFGFGPAAPLIFLKRYKESEKMLEMTLKVKPDHFPSIETLIEVYRRSRRWEKAEKASLRMIADYPNVPAGAYHLGKVYYLKGHEEKAEAYFQKAVSLDTAASPIRGWKPLVIGRFYRMHSEVDKAREYLRQKIEMDAEAPITFRNYHRLFYLGGNILFNTNRKMSYAHWNLAWLNLEDGRVDEALKIYDEAIEFDPAHAFSYYGKALVFYFSNQYDKADRWFAKAAQLDHDYAFARQACAAFQEGKLDEAAAAFEKAIEAINDDNLRYLLCRLKTEQGKYDEALDLLELDLNAAFTIGPFEVIQLGGHSFQFIQNDPALKPLRKLHRYQQLMRNFFPEKYNDLDTFVFEPEEVYYIENSLMFSEIYRLVGQLSNASHLLEKVIEQKPDTSTAEPFFLAKAYFQLGRARDAQRICPDTLQSGRHDDMLTAGEVYYMLGDYGKAARYFNRFVEGAKDKAEAHQKITRIYGGHGAIEDAVQHIRAAKQVKPDWVWPYQALAWLEFSAGHYRKAVQYLEEGEHLQPSDKDTRNMKILFRYFTEPSDSSRILFETAEKAQPGFLALWEFLEQMRHEKYTEAIETYPKAKASLLASRGWWVLYLEHLYLGALVQTGDMDAAASILDETVPDFLHYQLISTHPLLEPLRKTETYQDFIKTNFPEKSND